MPRVEHLNDASHDGYNEDFYRARNTAACAALFDLLVRHHPQHCPAAAVKRNREIANIRHAESKPDPLTAGEMEDIRISSWVADQFRQPKSNRPWNDTGKLQIARIQGLVCQAFGISRTDMLSSRRTRNLAVPRHIASYLARRLTSKSLPQIGAAFGGRDHTTILNSLRWVADNSAQNPKLADQIESLASALAEIA